MEDLEPEWAKAKDLVVQQLVEGYNLMLLVWVLAVSFCYPAQNFEASGVSVAGVIQGLLHLTYQSKPWSQ